VRLRNDFGLSLDSQLPALGAVSDGLRVVSESWSAAGDSLTLNASGAAAQHYDLAVLNPTQVRAVDGAELVNGKLSRPISSGSVWRLQPTLNHIAFPGREAPSLKRDQILYTDSNGGSMLNASRFRGTGDCSSRPHRPYESGRSSEDRRRHR